MTEVQDNWSANDYQNAASFVPKMATKVVQWLDLKPDDVLLDVGCGDGILNADFAKILAQGNGSQVGIDSSADMIKAARELSKNRSNSTFEVLDAGNLTPSTLLPQSHFTKIFSNAALHWILRPPHTHDTLFPTLYSFLRPRGTLTFEMGGLGNVAEMRSALLMATARRIGLAAALEVDPWFFPEEEWISRKLETAGFKVDKIERQWRATPADKGGVEGWVRLFGKMFIDAVPEAEREDVVKEAVDVLREVCKNPAGGEMLSYVRLRCHATKT